MSEQRFDAVRTELRRALWRAGRSGVTARQLARTTRHFRALSLEDRASELQGMVRDRLCVRIQRGRAVRYVDADFRAPAA